MIASTINYTFSWTGQNREVILAGSFLDNWNGRQRMEFKGNQWVYSIVHFPITCLEPREKKVLL